MHVDFTHFTYTVLRGTSVMHNKYYIASIILFECVSYEIYVI